jgi:uncharacterized membrane protein YhaH (DUF805 family)
LADVITRLQQTVDKGDDMDHELLPKNVPCPHCNTRLELDQEEQERRIFVCAKCGKLTDCTQPQTMFLNPFSLNGRIGRAEFVISSIILFVISFALEAIEIELQSEGLIDIIYIIPLWFSWAQGSKRCHDLGHSTWSQIIPFYIFFMWFAEGTRGWNEYGRDPKR